MPVAGPPGALMARPPAARPPAAQPPSARPSAARPPAGLRPAAGGSRRAVPGGLTVTALSLLTLLGVWQLAATVFCVPATRGDRLGARRR